ncbi:MAG TPA: hypothetical protein VGJ18_06460 [Gemmatimonadaceae bacterium]|jgi:hypothetical protein
MVSLLRLVLLCVVVTACGEYAHTNPYDPATNISILIAGPDSAHSIHENLSFTFEVSRSWPGVVPQWLSGNDAIIGARGPGQFQVNGNGTADVLVAVGAHIGHHRVVVVQRAKQALFCYYAPCPTSLALGAAATLNVVQADSLGTVLLSAQAAAQVQYDVRPAGVLQIMTASPSSVQVKAIGTGRAYVVAALGTYMDSVAVTVQ